MKLIIGLFRTKLPSRQNIFTEDFSDFPGRMLMDLIGLSLYFRFIFVLVFGLLGKRQALPGSRLVFVRPQEILPLLFPVVPWSLSWVLSCAHHFNGGFTR
jgi:hypothetical protein